MNSNLTGTMGFGVSARWLASALEAMSGAAVPFTRDPEAARRLGIGTVQVEALGAWLRFAGIGVNTGESDGLSLSKLGQAFLSHDPSMLDRGTWWALHYHLSRNYLVWNILSRLEKREYELDNLDEFLQAIVSSASPRTIKNARRSLISALRQTPIGTDLGLVRLEESGRTVTKLEKLTVRRQAVPLPVFAYCVAHWAREQGVSSASLDRLAQPDAPGGILHLSLGGLERNLMEVHGVFAGDVLTYSRTAGLDEAYFHFGRDPLLLLECYYRLREVEASPREVLKSLVEFADDRSSAEQPATEKQGEQT